MKSGGRYKGKDLEEVAKAVEMLSNTDTLHSPGSDLEHVALMIRNFRSQSVTAIRRFLRPLLPLSDIEKNRLIVLDFETDLWKLFSLKGAIVPDELLKECQRRLHLAESNPGSISDDELAELMKILKILDVIHRKRKTSSSINHHTSKKFWEPGMPIAPEIFRKKIGSDFGKRFWAVIIGNDAYPADDELKGCINDAKMVQEHLEEYLGVPSGNITLLPNATRAQTIDSLYGLRDNTDINPGDNILIHFSGHGATYDPSICFKTPAGQAGSIEAICPVDRGEEVPDISDRELNAILNAIQKERKANVTVFIDCCHGGGATRSGGGAVRSVSSLRTSAQTSGLDAMFRAADTDPRRSADMPFTSSESWSPPKIPGFVQLSGCHDFQIAREGAFEVGPNSKHKPTSQPSQIHERVGKSDSSSDARGPIVSNVKGSPPKGNIGVSKKQYGVFTWALVNALKSDIGQTGTYEQVIQSIGRLSDKQDPIVVGRKDSRLWFRD